MYLATTPSLLLCVLVASAWATIDINMSQFEYLANHITQADCRRLVAALHADSYELDPRVAQAGLVLPETRPCIELLLHWNSSPGEGRGQTHEVVSHRLRQLGYRDLATWLSKTVAHQLATRLEELQLPVVVCPYAVTTTERPSTTTEEILEDFEQEVKAKWTPFDSVWLAILIALAIIIVILVAIVVIQKVRKSLEVKRNLYEYKKMYRI